jgi:hypothetical protein
MYAGILNRPHASHGSIRLDDELLADYSTLFQANITSGAILEFTGAPFVITIVSSEDGDTSERLPVLLLYLSLIPLFS